MTALALLSALSPLVGGLPLLPTLPLLPLPLAYALGCFSASTGAPGGRRSEAAARARRSLASCRSTHSQSLRMPLAGVQVWRPAQTATA